MFEDEELAGLSDEERAAIKDDDDESDILKNIAGGDDNDDDEDIAGNSDESSVGHDDVGDTSAKAEDSITAEGDNGKGEEEDDTPAPEAEFQQEFRSQIPDGLEEKISSLDRRSEELMQKFKDGDVDLPEFMAQKSSIDDERMQLTLDQKQAEWALRQNEDSRAQRWKWEQERFFNQEKSSIYKDPIILAALDASVKQIASDPANAKKAPGFYLEEADRQVRKRFNMGEQPAKTAKAQNRQPDLSGVPKTLAQLPAAEMPETGDVEFAHLDKLDGIALEQALRKLTPEQEARYLGSAA